MKDYQKNFIKFCIDNDVLTFGEFSLKSGRKSPYFFNIGALIKTGEGLYKLGQYYAESILTSTINFDILYGPAYKGIPLASCAGIALADKGHNAGITFNRKETKDHGEGGQLIGQTNLANRNVLIIDDVITAGTAIHESMQIIEASGAKLAGVILALNRQERGQGDSSAITDIEKQYAVQVHSIIKLDDILNYLKESAELQQYSEAVAAYKLKYGA